MATPSLSLCRVCLSNISESKSIFSAILEEANESIKYSDILKKLSAEIFLDPDDGLPQQICLECQLKIASAFQIQKTFKNSDRILRVKVCLAIEKPGCEQEDNNPVDLEFIKLEIGEEELFDVQDDMEQKDPIEGHELLKTENQVQVAEKKSYTCDICNNQRQFYNIHSLRRHKRVMHRDMCTDGQKKTFESNTEQLDCPETILNTKAHSDRKSEGDNSITCDICNKQLSNIQNLRRHKKTLHNVNYSEELRERRLEGKLAKKKLQKTRKKFEVVRKKLFACNICNDKSQLFNIHSLRRHKSMMHGDMSTESFPKSELLDDQSNTNLMDLPELIIIKNNSFTCEICNDQRPFFSTESLERHKKLMHSDMSPDGQSNHKSESFDDQTTSQSNIEHMDLPKTILDTKTHSDRKSEGDKSLTCNICNKQLSNIQNLRRHKKTLHNDRRLEDKPTKLKLDPLDDQSTSQSNTKQMDQLSPEKSEGDDSFTCEICIDRRKFFNIYSLIRHKKILHNVKYSDELRKRRLKAKLQRAQKKIQKTRKFPCNICTERSFPHKYSLERHIKVMHNSNESSENTCFICPRKFPNKFKLDLHSPHHYKSIEDITPDQKEKYEILECYCCEMFFFDKKSRFIHVLKEHNKRWSCKYCETNFTTPHELSSHIINHNVAIRDPQKIEEYKLRKSGVKIDGDVMKERPFTNRNKITKRKIVDKRRHPCEICKISFAAEQSLIRHTKTLHSNASNNIQPKPKFSCDQCHRSCISQERLFIHAARHLTSIDDLSAEQAASCKIFECYSCDKFFFDSNSRFLHLQRQHSSQISCKYCNERFEKVSLLKTHITIHNKLIANPQSVEEYKRQKADEVKRGIIMKCDTTRYSCDTCKMGFTSPHRLYNHNRKMHLDKHLSDERPFVCELCDSRFKTEYFYTHHQNTMHSEPITLEEAESNPLVACKICLKRFVSEKGCKLHHEKHKPLTSYTVLEFELPSGYQCFACGLIFTSPNARRIHALTHGAGDFKCTKCSEKFTWVTDLHRHIRRKHKLYKKQYKCDICSKIVNNLTEFKRHMIRHQPKGEKLFSCQICEKKFRLARQLDAHIKRVHENEPVPLCPECGKMVKESMNVHISREHRSEYLHQCPKCPRKFKTKSSLYLHVRSHDRLKSEKKFHCDECNAAFRYEPYVTTHKQRVHQKKAKPFKCEQCPKSFYSKYKLGVHFRIHSKEKPFECEHCDRAFSQKGDFTKHLRLQHIGDNVYKCTICEAGFRFLRDLKLHYEEHPPSADNLDAKNDKNVGDVNEDNGN